ncbi:MAG: ATP-dependent Clp protease ATP-binding subunit ClpC, partial [Clostridiales bacterium]|nr:ATP-dependent Clp protease ATP-binding subunit ClpC [Clostridiales bacterium]
MMQKLTERAQRTLQMAEERARGARAAFVGTEHILWAIAAEGEGVGAKALKFLRISAESIDRIIDDKANVGENFNGFSPSAKRSFMLARDEAALMGLDFIGTEHLLLGLFAEGEGLAANYIRQTANVSLPKLRMLVMQILRT